MRPAMQKKRRTQGKIPRNEHSRRDSSSLQTGFGNACFSVSRWPEGRRPFSVGRTSACYGRETNLVIYIYVLDAERAMLISDGYRR